MVCVQTHEIPTVLRRHPSVAVAPRYPKRQRWDRIHVTRSTQHEFIDITSMFVTFMARFCLGGGTKVGGLEGADELAEVLNMGGIGSLFALHGFNEHTMEQS